MNVSSENISRRNNFLSAQIAVARVNFVAVKIFTDDSAAEKVKINFGERDLPRKFFGGKSRFNRQKFQAVKFNVIRFGFERVKNFFAEHLKAAANSDDRRALFSASQNFFGKIIFAQAE